MLRCELPVASNTNHAFSLKPNVKGNLWELAEYEKAEVPHFLSKETKLSADDVSTAYTETAVCPLSSSSCFEEDLKDRKTERKTKQCKYCFYDNWKDHYDRRFVYCE